MMGFGIKRKREIKEIDVKDNVESIFEKSLDKYNKELKEDLRNDRKEFAKELAVQIVSAMQEDVPVNKTTQGYIVQKVNGLNSEKKSNEIIAMLMEKMTESNRHPQKLRSFYTDLERDCAKYLSDIHKRRTEGITKGEVGKYPYRKMDTVLMELDEGYVFDFAKNYTFKTK
jgi:uncharacterized protein with von Willebrand factor type A (vWA) domain